MATGAQTNPFEEDRLNHSADYRRAWDVPSLNAEASDWLTREVAAVRDSSGISASRKIAVLLGPPGFGKTHLFGRVADALGQDVVFVFVPQILEEQLTRPLQHIRWHVVECLFEPATGNTPRVTQLLSKLCRESFENYFDRLPEQLRARHQTLRQKLADDSTAVMDILSPVKDLTAYQKLADSVVKQFPHLPSDIVRAVVLGWSPASNDARRWLRGDDINEAERKKLQLSEEPPPAIGVIKTIATLLQAVKLPLVICCDQLEAVIKDLQVGPHHFSNGLMQVLQEVPNVLLVISCFSDKWSFLAHYWVKSFLDRCHPPHALTPVSETQAVELVANRILTWRGRRADRGATWPIAEASIREFVTRSPQPARVLVKVCKASIDNFNKQGELDEVRVISDAAPTALVDLFTQYWNEELGKIQQTALSPDDVQEDALFQGISEALTIVQSARQLPPGIELKAATKNAIKATPADPRPSLNLRIVENGKAFTVVLGVTKRDTGMAFTNYVKELEAAVSKADVCGAVLVRPRLEPGVAKSTDGRKRFDSLITAQKLRPFALEQERLTFDILQCLLKLLKDADGKMVQLGGKMLSPHDCKKFIAETGLLRSLRLFDLIFAGWRSENMADEVVESKVETAAVVKAESGAASRKRKAGVSAPAARLMPATVAATSSTNGNGSATPSAPPLARPQMPAAPVSESKSWALHMLQEVVTKLRNFGLPVKPLGIQIGPCFARLKVLPEDQTDINKVRRKDESLRVFLNLRVKPLIGFQAGYLSIDLELPKRLQVPLLPLLKRRPPELIGQPAFPLGLDVAGKDHWLNLADSSNCHLLIAGTTGSGKSELMKALLAGLADGLTPSELQIILIDPKRVTFNFPGISPYFRAPIAHDPAGAIPLLQSCVEEMERRYKLLEKSRKSNINELKGADAQPQIVLIFDEFADLMQDKESKKELEGHLKRLGAMARAAGIHLVLGTQRTEASVVTPLLRSNLPGRISLKVTSERDSELILNDPGASGLLGRGDLLWLRGGDLLRLQCPFVTPEQLDTLLQVD